MSCRLCWVEAGGAAGQRSLRASGTRSRLAKLARLQRALRAAEAWASSCHQRGLFLLGTPSPPAAPEKEHLSCTQLPCPVPSYPSSCPSSCPPTQPAAGWEARTLPQSSPCL